MEEADNVGQQRKAEGVVQKNILKEAQTKGGLLEDETDGEERNKGGEGEGSRWWGSRWWWGEEAVQ